MTDWNRIYRDFRLVVGVFGFALFLWLAVSGFLWAKIASLAHQAFGG